MVKVLGPTEIGEREVEREMGLRNRGEKEEEEGRIKKMLLIRFMHHRVRV
jgi:hypothetical protein